MLEEIKISDPIYRAWCSIPNVALAKQTHLECSADGMLVWWCADYVFRDWTGISSWLAAADRVYVTA